MKKLTRRTLISLAALLPVIRVNAAVSGRFDVIVVGAGIAGLAAAVSAAENGAKRVLVLEKGPMIGGHAIYADGTVSAVYPRLQKVFNIKDSPELMAKQIWEWGDRDGDLSLIRVMARESGSRDRLASRHGRSFPGLGFRSVSVKLSPRSHVTPDPGRLRIYPGFEPPGESASCGGAPEYPRGAAPAVRRRGHRGFRERPGRGSSGSTHPLSSLRQAVFPRTPT